MQSIEDPGKRKKEKGKREIDMYRGNGVPVIETGKRQKAGVGK